MEIKSFKTGEEYTDLQFPDEKGDLYCIRFRPDGGLIHAKYHKDPTTSMEPGQEISTKRLEAFLSKHELSLEELKKHL